MSVLLASLVAVVGLWYSVVQVRQELVISKEGQLTSRYTAAVANLGEDKMDVRLGGIYALQRIMQDSPRDHPTIGNVLAAYVRTHAAEPPAKGQGIPADIHAALTILADRDATHDQDFRLDLRSAQLPRAELASHDPAQGGSLADGAALADADLTRANLTRAFLFGANLARANLTEANLTRATLSSTNLSRAILSDADLTGVNLAAAELTDTGLDSANLTGADMRNTDMRGAYLTGADLTDAYLIDASLRGANLTGAENLTRMQVDSARTDGKTRLPAGLS
ncbi:pentapeptide repeat-containing protein [Streptomyces niveus]